MFHYKDSFIRIKILISNEANFKVKNIILIYSRAFLSLFYRIHIIKLPILVEGDLKAPFSIATTPRYTGGRYSIPIIAPLYPWSLPYKAEC